MWEVVDPDGRVVVLDWPGWQHVLRRHPDLGVQRRVVLETVADPAARRRGRAHGEDWFYARGVGPSAWLRVVVHYEGDRGLIVTAFARRSFP